MNSVEVVSLKVRMSAAMPMGARSGILAEGTFDDPENARIIYFAVGGLLLLAAVLGVGTWYWWRTSKVEHPALGPLEMMGTRAWRKGDFNSRARYLEESRPANAIHEADPLNEPDEFDLDALVNVEAAKFDDFADLLPAGPAAEPVAAAAAVAVADAAATAGSDSPDLADEVAEVVADPAPDLSEPARAKPGIIVIDTAPANPAPLQLAFDEPEPSATDRDDADDLDHFDPLLRLNITE